MRARARRGRSRRSRPANVLSTVLADRCRRCAEEHEHRREAEHERHARDDDAPRRRLARRGGRPRPRRRPTDSPGRAAARTASRPRAGRRGTRPEASQPSNRSSSSSIAPLESPRRAAAAPGGAGPAGARVQCRAPSPSTTTPARSPADRQHPREQVEPVLRRRRSTPGPKLATISSRICFSVQPCGDPLPDQRLHLLRDRSRRLVERLVADRADELRLDRGCVRAACRPAPARRAASTANASATQLSRA